MRILIALLALFFLFQAEALALSPDEVMADPGQEARARAITRNLRCVVCQGESIDDSQAGLARDMRHFVRAEIAAGKGDDEIIEGLRTRYGDFVLMRPRLGFNTLLLWAGPFLVLVSGFLVARRVFARGKGEG